VSLFNSHYHESAASGDEIRAPSRVALTFFRARLKISLLAATVTALIKHQSRGARWHGRSAEKLIRQSRGAYHRRRWRRFRVPRSTPSPGVARLLHFPSGFISIRVYVPARRIRTRLPEFAQSRSEGSGRSGTRLYYRIATEGGFRKESERHRYDVRSVSPTHIHTHGLSFCATSAQDSMKKCRRFTPYKRRGNRIAERRIGRYYYYYYHYYCHQYPQ